MSEQESKQKAGRDEKPSPAEAAPAADGGKDPNALSPEEQMALYEEDLKENDWGHQPC